MMLISDFTVMCDCCGKKYRIPSDSLDIDYACSERPMGTEIQHIFYGEMDCECGNRLSYTITVVEYPEGAYNFHTCEAVGCTYVEKPGAEMEYDLPDPVLSVYEEILQNPEYAYNLEPWEFEEFVADVFRRMGFNADVTQKTHDGGKDIVATFEIGGVLYTTYFECKKYSPNRPVDLIEISTLSKRSGNIQLINNSDKRDGNTLLLSSQSYKNEIKSHSI